MDIRVFLSSRASDTISDRIGEDAMKEYTAKEMKLLKANPYTFKVSKNKLYCVLVRGETTGTIACLFPPKFVSIYESP